MKRPKPKSRRTKAECPHHSDKQQRRPSRDEWDYRSAPSHMGGQFDDAGYGPSGGFGFHAYHPQRYP